MAKQMEGKRSRTGTRNGCRSRLTHSHTQASYKDTKLEAKIFIQRTFQIEREKICINKKKINKKDYYYY